MKIIILLLIAITIVFKQAPKSQACDVYAAKRAIPPRIFYEQTIDGNNQPVLITRFLHNKIGIFASEVVKCYFNVIAPNAMYQSAGIFGLILEIYLIYTIIVWKKWYVSAILLVLPFAPFFNIFENLVIYAHKLLALSGLVLLAKRRK